MKVEERIPLATYTTFGVGGDARFFVEARTRSDIEDAVSYARHRGVAIYPLGAGSNILVPDIGVSGLVLKVSLSDITLHEQGAEVLLVAGAGVKWEEVVEYATRRELFGIENLAGIPGTIGGAAVQNIGAYGVEFSSSFEYADVFNIMTNTYERISNEQASFAYRSSFFKKHHELIIVSVALRLTKHGAPNVSYPDLQQAKLGGVSLTTPIEIAQAVRTIRSCKFPESHEGGTAGSFFKNPVVDKRVAEAVARQFPGVPLFPQKDGSVKIPLAWILDHALALKGFSNGNARLHDKQPLVLVARSGASATEIDLLASEVARRVFSETKLVIEREVETFSDRKIFFF